MIRRVKVIHREINTWARGNTFEGSQNNPFHPNQVMFEKDYPRQVPTEVVWEELRQNMMVAFFGIFYPQVVDSTKADSQYIQRRRQEHPNLYEFIPEERKWAISEAGYISRVVFGKEGDGTVPNVNQVAEAMNIGIAEADEVSGGRMGSVPLLNQMQHQNAGQTHSVVLFVYPDRYDQEIRSIFELEVTHWD